MPSGNIILLNGTSSSGKTTLAKALQEMMPEPYFLIGMDMFQPGFPPGILSPETTAGWKIVFREGALVEVLPGPAAIRFLTGMYRGIAALASAGNHVIVDDVIYHPAILRVMAEELSDAPVLFVGVRIPLEVGEQREIERGNRAPGGARLFYPAFALPGQYDLEVDTGSESPEACAQKIKATIESGQVGKAIRGLITT